MEVSTRSSRRSVGVRTVLAVEAVASTGLVVWSVIGGPCGVYAALACVVIGALAAVRPVRERCRTRWHRIQFALRRARRDPRDVLTPAFDVPLAGATWRDGVAGPTAQMGARWVNDTLITMLGIHADARPPTIATPDGVVADGPSQTLTVSLIANCLNTFDITVDSVDLISHGQRMTGPPHIAQVYHATLGPLPAVANRTTFVVIRLRPADCADAVARRGGGSLGAVRAALVTTRRITAALHDAGIAATILTSRQITDATMFLTDGVPIGDVGESWAELSRGSTRLRTFALSPHDAPTVAAATGWSHRALSTTLTVRVRPGPAGPVYAGLLRVSECPASNRVLAQPVRGLHPLAGRQFEALCATLPVGSSPWLDRHLSWAPVPDAGPPLPIRGCGQLIGADESGHGLTIALTSVPTVVAIGQQPWVWQLVVRALATGAAARVTTDRRDYWQPLIAVVGDSTALCFDDAPVARGAQPVLRIIDEGRGMPIQFTDSQGTDAGTALHVFDAGPSPAVRGAAIRLVQDPTAPGFVDVEVAGLRHRVSIVATPDEWRLLGASGDRVKPAMASV